MIITRPEVEQRGHEVMVAANIVPRHAPAFRLEYAVAHADPAWTSRTADPFVPPVLMLAMATGEDVVVEAPVSPRLMDRLSRIGDIYVAWQPGLRRVNVVAPTQKTAVGGPGVGLFFSGGVDSFHSLVKNAEDARAGTQDAVTHLILVFGFDVKLGNPALFGRIEAGARGVARALDKQLVVVRTNVRSFSDAHAPWSIYHGGPMGGVALLLAPLFHRCLVASSYSYAELFPWGSHPLLDPLWSTEALELVHDGCEVTRMQKILRIAAHPVALQALRVCWSNGQSAYNCGRCEKCLRTMIGLHIAKALDRCTTFDRPLTPEAVRRMPVASDGSVRFLEDLLGYLGDTGIDRALASAMRAAIRRRSMRRLLADAARRSLGPRVALRARGLLARVGMVGRERHADHAAGVSSL